MNTSNGGKRALAKRIPHNANFTSVGSTSSTSQYPSYSTRVDSSDGDTKGEPYAPPYKRRYTDFDDPAPGPKATSVVRPFKATDHDRPYNRNAIAKPTTYKSHKQLEKETSKTTKAPFMLLNEKFPNLSINSRLSYTNVSRNNAPYFRCSLNMYGKNYSGEGVSKKTAKHNMAVAALAEFGGNVAAGDQGSMAFAPAPSTSSVPLSGPVIEASASSYVPFGSTPVPISVLKTSSTSAPHPVTEIISSKRSDEKVVDLEAKLDRIPVSPLIMLHHKCIEKGGFAWTPIYQIETTQVSGSANLSGDTVQLKGGEQGPPQFTNAFTGARYSCRLELSSFVFKGESVCKQTARNNAAKEALNSLFEINMDKWESGFVERHKDKHLWHIMLHLANFKGWKVDENMSQQVEQFVCTMTVKNQKFVGEKRNSERDAREAVSEVILVEVFLLSPQLIERHQGRVVSDEFSLTTAGKRRPAAVTIPQNPSEQTLTRPSYVSPIADTIAKLVQDKYETICAENGYPSKGKEIAGIVMTTGTHGPQTCQIVSLGTGTKCISGKNISHSGLSLNDCHAEVLARRGLVLFLSRHLQTALDHPHDPNNIFYHFPGTSHFKLKDSIQFHLYITSAPCGDARIFSMADELSVNPKKYDNHRGRRNRGLLRVKIESGMGTVPAVSKNIPTIQTFDAIVAGERITCLSCSDKVLRWNALGLQGALLSCFTEPIYMETLVVGSLFHEEHIKRAIHGRLGGQLEFIPPGYKLKAAVISGISNPFSRTTLKAPDISCNWVAVCSPGSPYPRMEVITPETGKCPEGVPSRLSKRAMFDEALTLVAKFASHGIQVPVTTDTSYAEFKLLSERYQSMKTSFVKALADAGYGTWIKKPAEMDDFHS